jgi:hypothetical protein
MGIATSTVNYYLTNVLEMKYRHFRWLPDMLILSQKATGLNSAKRMLLAMAKYQTSHFHFPFAGNKSWIFYSYHREATWVPSWSNVDDHDHRFLPEGKK